MVKKIIATLLLLCGLAFGADLKQNLVTTIKVGPFINTADNTVNTTITVTNVVVVIQPESDTRGGVAVITFSPTVAGGGTHDMSLPANGKQYELELEAADVAVLGRVDFTFTYTGCYPIFDRYTVVPSGYWDCHHDGNCATVADIFSNQTTNGEFSTAGGIGKLFVDNIPSGIASTIWTTSINDFVGVPAWPMTADQILAALGGSLVNKKTTSATAITTYDSSNVSQWKKVLSSAGNVKTEGQAVAP